MTTSREDARGRDRLLICVPAHLCMYRLLRGGLIIELSLEAATETIMVSEDVRHHGGSQNMGIIHFGGLSDIITDLDRLCSAGLSALGLVSGSNDY